MALVINANKTGETDGSMANMLNRINCHTPIVIVSRCENFVFNDELLGLQNYILCNAAEMGWDYDWGRKTPIFGHSHFNHYEDLFRGEGYKELNRFVADRRPMLTLQRELLKRDASEKVLPIEYCAWYESPIQDEPAFNARPLEVFFNWGLSNPMRPNLHGDIWKRANDLGYSVCDTYYSLQKFFDEENNKRKWATINTAHYVRHPMQDVLQINGMSKISVCLWGAGRRCFRHSESPINSVMFLPEDDFAWTFNWVSGINCIKYRIGDNVVEVLNEATKRKDLYEIYLSGVENCKKYLLSNYTSYLANIINNAYV